MKWFRKAWTADAYMSEHWISNFFTSRTQNWHRLDHRSIIWQSFWNVRRPNSHTFWQSVAYERHYCENNPLTDSWECLDMDKQSIMSCWIRRTLLSNLSENRGYMFCTLHPVLIFFVSVSLWEYADSRLTECSINQDSLHSREHGCQIYKTWYCAAAGWTVPLTRGLF